MSINRNYRQLPKVAFNLLWNHRAWLVGSGAFWYRGLRTEAPSDFDIMVHPDDFQTAMMLLKVDRAGAEDVEPIGITSFGGIYTVTSDGYKIDIFPLTLEKYIEVNNATGLKCALRLRPWAAVEWGGQ